MSVTDIDTKLQQFTIDLVLLGRSVGLAAAKTSEGDAVTIENWEPRIRFMNIIETMAWKCRPRQEKDGEISFKFNIKATFGEEMELGFFPYDLQKLSLVFSTPIPLRRKDGTEVLKFGLSDHPSVIQMKNYRLGKVWHLFKKVTMHIKESDMADSTSLTIRPIVEISLCVARTPMYYTSNIELPMALITGLSFTVAAISKDDVADRLGVTLTLLLTAVAYKLMMSDSLPNVAYLTLLDKFLLGCFAFLALLSAEVALVKIESLADLDGVFLGILALVYVAALALYAMLRCHAFKTGNSATSPDDYISVLLEECATGGRPPPPPMFTWLYDILAPLILPCVSTPHAAAMHVAQQKLSSALAATTSHKGIMRNAIIAGAPASGKGTQCKKIVEHFGIVHLSTGDILRKAVESGSEVGLRVKGTMEAGGLVDDSTMCDIVVERLSQEDCKKKGWLLDGFPRTKAQAEALSAAGFFPDCFICLDVPDAKLTKRVLGRLTDPKTGMSYHEISKPPPTEEIRRRCTKRADDTEEKVGERLRNYHGQTEAVIPIFNEVLVCVNGDRPEELVSADVIVALLQSDHPEARRKITSSGSNPMQQLSSGGDEDQGSLI